MIHIKFQVCVKFYIFLANVAWGRGRNPKQKKNTLFKTYLKIYVYILKTQLISLINMTHFSCHSLRWIKIIDLLGHQEDNSVQGYVIIHLFLNYKIDFYQIILQILIKLQNTFFYLHLLYLIEIQRLFCNKIS